MLYVLVLVGIHKCLNQRVFYTVSIPRHKVKILLDLTDNLQHVNLLFPKSISVHG